jgi:hypothetical protein
MVLSFVFCLLLAMLMLMADAVAEPVRGLAPQPAPFRDAFGKQVRCYASINPEGKEILVRYVSDSNGFRGPSDAVDLPLVSEGE